MDPYDEKPTGKPDCQPEPDGHACRRRPGTSYAEDSATVEDSTAAEKTASTEESASAEDARPVQQILYVLDVLGHNVRRCGDGWTANCPTHADFKPRLRITETNDGDFRLICHYGCDVEDILEGLGFCIDYLPSLVVEEEIPASSAREMSTVWLETALDAERDWATLIRKYKKQCSKKQRARLVKQLGVPVAALKSLHVGWQRWKDGEGRYTFPECDGEGRIVGISTRTTGGQKKVMRGSKRGLYLPAGWSTRQGPIFVAEGASDTAAMTAMGLAGIGRPAASGGIRFLEDLLADIPPERPIIILGEMDCKPDGSWVGRDGAVKVAKKLARALGREVLWGLPFDGAKDVRAWFSQQQEKED